MIKTKAVLIGLGKMGFNHLRVLSENKSFEIVAVVDPNVERLPTMIQVSVPLLRSIEELKNFDFDCAIIATPTSTHYEIAKKLLEMGKNLLVEKPLAKTYSECQALIELA